VIDGNRWSHVPEEYFHIEPIRLNYITELHEIRFETHQTNWINTTKTMNLISKKKRRERIQQKKLM